MKNIKKAKSIANTERNRRKAVRHHATDRKVRHTNAHLADGGIEQVRVLDLLGLGGMPYVGLVRSPRLGRGGAAATKRGQRQLSAMAEAFMRASGI